MKLHLPVSLRKSVIACILATAGIFPSISISAASWGIAVCLLGTPSAKAEISTVTISSSGKSELISTPDDSLIIMNLNRGYLYGSSTLNSSFDENTFNPFFNGSVTYSEQLTGVIGLSYFELLGFSLPSELEVSAILSDQVTLRNNGSIRFSDNTVVDSRSVSGGVVTCGAAISGQRIGGNVVLDGNREVLFERNIAGGRGAVEGGAIFNLGNSISGNERVVFNENAAIADSSWSAGGAIRGNLSLVRNKEVIFSGNKAQSGVSSAEGGAIFGWDLQLNENESLSFTSNAAIVTSSDSNSAVTTGGAIYALQNAVGPYVDNRCLSICNNGSVLFAKNYELNKGNYRLRSIYVSDNGEGCVLISAAQGKRVEFRDSVYIGSENTLLLNADYTDAAENTTRQTGDIIFTGATTVDDLYTVKDNVAGTTEEIRLSRTTEVNTLTNLYGGRLRVEDGAIYLGQGITVHEGSEATVRVKDAELNHAGYEMSFNAGTSLEVAGESTIRGNVALKEGSLFKLEQGAVLCLHEMAEADAAILTVNGTAFLSGASMLNASLTLADGATLDMDNPDAGAVTLNGALTFGGQVTMGENLLAILLEMSAWGESVTLFTGIESLVLPVMASSEASNHVWVGDVFSNLVGYEQYYFNYVPDVGSLMVVHVPEPTTTTLGLLTLAGLALRRRRK